MAGLEAHYSARGIEARILAVFVDNLGQKAGNARRSLEEHQVRLVGGVFRAE